jgi:hypothetical protein
LEPRGDFGKLLGFNVDLKSYRIQPSDSQIVNSKNVQFLNFDSIPNPSAFDLSDLTEEQQVKKGEKVDPPQEEEAGKDSPHVKEEEDNGIPPALLITSTPLNLTPAMTILKLLKLWFLNPMLQLGAFYAIKLYR